MRKFVYNNDYFDGLFNFLRKDSFLFEEIRVTSKTSYIVDIGGFCYKYGGGYPESIVNGNQNVAWCNLNYAENEQQIFIDIGHMNFFELGNVVIATVCEPPNEIEILGSNDNITFESLCKLNDVNKENSQFYRECKNMKAPFRFFQLRQNGVNTNREYRFHIQEIEFFGTLYDMNIKSCNHFSLAFIHSIIISFVLSFTT